MNQIKITLAAARVNAGLTQEDVAKELHVSKQTIVNWEKGKCAVGYAQAKALEALYNIPMDNIFLPSSLT